MSGHSARDILVLYKEVLKPNNNYIYIYTLQNTKRLLQLQDTIRKDMAEEVVSKAVKKETTNKDKILQTSLYLQL